MQITGGELPRFMDRDDSNEENREYNRQHGEQLFKMLLEEIGNHRLIAEDLGEAPPCDRLWSNCRSRVSKSRSGNVIGSALFRATTTSALAWPLRHP